MRNKAELRVIPDAIVKAGDDLVRMMGRNPHEFMEGVYHLWRAKEGSRRIFFRDFLDRALDEAIEERVAEAADKDEAKLIRAYIEALRIQQTEELLNCLRNASSQEDFFSLVHAKLDWSGFD